MSKPTENVWSFFSNFLRGHRGHDGRIDSAAEKTGHWNIGEKMFVDGFVDQIAHVPENVIRRRNKCFTRWPVSPCLDLSLPRDRHGMAGRQDAEVRVKKISFRAGAPLQIAGNGLPGDSARSGGDEHSHFRSRAEAIRIHRVIERLYSETVAREK